MGIRAFGPDSFSTRRRSAAWVAAVEGTVVCGAAVLACTRATATHPGNAMPSPPEMVDE
jgi:hypothetical protein